MLAELLLDPFLDFAFMRRALVGCVALTLGSTPIGVFLILRRMSLTGGAIGHAILPGVALGFLVAGLSLPAMTTGGIIAGLAVALAAGAVSRATILSEDASLAAFHLIALALGVLIVSTQGSNVDLLHVLFGTVLALDDAALFLIATITSLTLATMAAIYRGLVVECFDGGFLRAAGGGGSALHLIFMTLAVLNLVGGFQALGTLMVVGILILPAAAARFWVSEVASLIVCAWLIGIAACITGLLLSYHLDLPSGPAIILVAGAIYALSLGAGPIASLASLVRRPAHLEG